MNYNIKFVMLNNYNKGFNTYRIDTFELKFFSKSERQIENSLEEAYGILQDKLIFDNIDSLNTDVFRAFEYYSLKEPGTIKEYFMYMEKLASNQIKELGINKSTSKTLLLGVMTSLDVKECNCDNKKLSRVCSNIFRSMPHTTKILSSLFHKRRKTITSEDIKYDMSFGTLVFKGYSTPFFRWEFNGFAEGIFKKTDNLDTLDMAERITNTLERINFKVNTGHMTELIDATDLNECRCLHLYTLFNKEKVTAFIESFFMMKLNERMIFSISNIPVDGAYTPIDVYKALIGNKNTNIASNFRYQKSLFLLHEIIQELTKKYLILQVDRLISTNNYDTAQDVWKYYYLQNDKVKVKTFDFTSVKKSYIKIELKKYVINLLEKDSQTKNTIRNHKTIDSKISNYNLIRDSIVYFVDVHEVEFFADITPELVTEYIEDLFSNALGGRIHSSLRTVSSTISAMRQFSDWISRNAEIIRSIKPDRDVFMNVEFYGTDMILAKQEGTEIIPDIIIEQIQEKLHLLKPPVCKRMLLCLLNAPRRFNEFQLMKIGDLKPIKATNRQLFDDDGNPAYSMFFTEHKKVKNREIDSHGNNIKRYKKTIPINCIVANTINEQIEETKELEKRIRAKYGNRITITNVFVKEDDKTAQGYTLLNANLFNAIINAFLKDNHIVDENNEVWHFTTRQSRKTGAGKLVDAGHDLDVVQKQLGHERSETTFKSYIELSHMKMAEENTEYLRAEFDEQFGDDKKSFNKSELEAMFNKFLIDSNKVFYKRRLLGVCGLNLGEKCPNLKETNNTNVDDILPCADCPNLYVGEKCKSGWEQIYNQCKESIYVYEEFFKKNNMSELQKIKVKDYVQTYIKLTKAGRVIEVLS